MHFTILAQVQPIYNGPVVDWKTAFLIALPSILAFLSSIASLVVSSMNSQKLKDNSSKQNIIHDRQEVMSVRQEEIAHRINGLTEARIKTEGDAKHAEGVIEGMADEQRRVATNLAIADASSVRLEEIKGQNKRDKQLDA